MIVIVMSAAETAHALRTALGPIRGWHDLLADCLRGRTSLLGLKLLPIAKIKNVGDRVKRPVYAVSDVQNFIRDAYKKIGRPADTKEFRKIRLEIDPAMLLLPLGMRSAKLA